MSRLLSCVMLIPDPVSIVTDVDILLFEWSFFLLKSVALAWWNLLTWSSVVGSFVVSFCFTFFTFFVVGRPRCFRDGTSVSDMKGWMKSSTWFHFSIPVRGQWPGEGNQNGCQICRWYISWFIFRQSSIPQFNVVPQVLLHAFEDFSVDKFIPRPVFFFRRVPVLFLKNHFGEHTIHGVDVWTLTTDRNGTPRILSLIEAVNLFWYSNLIVENILGVSLWWRK